MNRALGHFCAHTAYIGPGEPPRDGEMSEMILLSRHGNRNLNPRGLRPSTLPLGHGGSPQYCVLQVDGEETFLFLSNLRDLKRTPNSSVKGSGAIHYPRVSALIGIAVKKICSLAQMTCDNIAYTVDSPR